MVDPEALRARIARGFSEGGLDEIAAAELVLGGEPAVDNREEPDEPAISVMPAQQTVSSYLWRTV